MTYTLINLVFLVPAAIVFGVALRRGGLSWRAGLGAAAILFALTIVFDNIMILVGLMEYSSAHSSGARIGLMPVEDLAYSLFAALTLPALWSLLGPTPQRGQPSTLADTGESSTGGTHTHADER
ncbi:lycopene cyclase domain-containing protein [Brevibacterium sp. 50QC2O2]|uniref:lycopene cyclase domain-containing protein n=1 Tax=Brevibacterium sp. 50QC2O2 TaxID=2968459 RepID=UPI00211D004F|nr:lycopene cyclase domain-containing protein [Brevibacterium sp. 50QC2O2]MCQ9389295.1 lycopene cyclase domain-containing protein [Brevibacterium sp. 50QC2O2]